MKRMRYSIKQESAARRIVLQGLGIAVTLLCLVAAAEAGNKALSPVPDLTKGGKLTQHSDFLVGPVGIKCLMWAPRRGSDDRNYIRQFQVKDVEKGSPADGVLAEGDVILGADGSGSPEVPIFDLLPHDGIADAINEAEARSPAVLKLLRWRKGKTETVSIQLESLGAYSDTAPYNCPKSKRILEKGLKAVYAGGSPGQGLYGILILLAADDPENPDNEKYQTRAKEWAHARIVSSVDEVPGGPWDVGNSLIALAEYYLKTKDQEVFPTVKYYAQRFANGQSWFGTTGHRWADRQPDGSPNGAMAGYGALGSSGLGGFFGMILARECGVNSPEVAAAIKRADTFFSSYAFRDGIPYGEHNYGIGGTRYDMNGKHAVAGLAFALQENRLTEARWFCAMATAACGVERRSAHGGPYWAQVFNPLGAALGGENAANYHFKEILRHLTLNRKWDGTFHYRGHNAYSGWSRAATQLLLYALPLRQLYITGSGHQKSLTLTQAGLDSIRGSRAFDAGSMSTQELITSLSSWAPPDRSKAVDELVRRAKEPDVKAGLLNQLHILATNEKVRPLERAGALFALSRIRDVSSIEVLVDRLRDSDYYVRFVAAMEVRGFPRDAVMPHVNTIMDIAATSINPTFPLLEGDPLQLAHASLAILLFHQRSGILTGRRGSIEGIDRKKLFAAARAIARTPAGAARSTLGNLYKRLSLEEMLELGDTIVESIRVRAPADPMFSSGIQRDGLDLLQKHSMEEAFPVIAGLPRVNDRLGYYSRYNAAVLNLETAPDVMEQLGDLQLVHGVDISRALRGLAATASEQPFNKMKEIHSLTAESSTLTLPTAKTTLRVKATNYARRDEKQTTYTWRKVYGAGKVSFTPNASWESKNTTVEFTGQKPGKYRFEVTMSDSRGYNVVRATVDVTLLGKVGWFSKEGTLPHNSPPTANSQSLEAVPGIPLPIILTGTDPDGDDLGFIVTQNPRHGKLTGSGADLRYTADFGYNGADRFTFNAIDGQGVTAPGTVRVTVSDRNVGVAVYEGFDYPAGPVNGREGGTSFGFSGPWKVEGRGRGVSQQYQVEDGSWSYASLPTTGGKLFHSNGHSTLTRQLCAKTLSDQKLLNDGKELWFSVMISNDRGQDSIYFGLKDGSEKGKAEVGFGYHYGRFWAIMSNSSGKTINRMSNRGEEIKFNRHKPHMLIGRCIWGKTDKDPDTLEIYRVFDAPGMGPLLLKEPISVITGLVPQADLNTFVFKASNFRMDEIRVGPTYHSVLLGTTPIKETK